MLFSSLQAIVTATPKAMISPGPPGSALPPSAATPAEGARGGGKSQDAGRAASPCAEWGSGGLAAIAHEINNPLNGMKVYLRLLRDELEPADPKRRYVEIIGRELDRVAAVTRRMSGLFEFGLAEVKAFYVQDLIEDVVAVLGVISRSRGIALRLSMPAERESGRVELPEAAVSQILYNLTQNAIQASSEGDAVSVGFHRDADQIVLEVSDEGCGIPDAIKTRIFEPFFTTKKEGDQRGMGLGLALVQSLVVSMKGEVQVESELDRGTVFRVTLPGTGRIDRG